jgi:hypothetical protein
MTKIHTDRRVKADGSGLETDIDIEIRKLKTALKEANEKIAAYDLRLAQQEERLAKIEAAVGAK